MIISDEWASGVARIASYTRTKEFPLLNNSEHYTADDVKRIFKANQLLQETWDELRRTNKKRTKSISKKE
jgi:hypothetical protein